MLGTVVLPIVLMAYFGGIGLILGVIVVLTFWLWPRERPPEGPYPPRQPWTPMSMRDPDDPY